MTGVLIHDVTLRDGLQIEQRVVPTDLKLAWIDRLIAARVDIIQVGSFVHPGKVPQMADTDELFRRLGARPRDGRVVLSALVLNEKGLERGLACGVEMLCMGVSASDTHSRKNSGMGTNEATTRIVAMASEAKQAGRRVQVSVQSAFGCGFEGPIDEARVMRIVEAYLAQGIHAISLADTAGHAHPAQVTALVRRILRLEPAAEITAHIHNTYGLGMANTYAALQAGVRCIETAVGGLGGCPFTKVAAGNVATEDLVHGLQRAGQCAGINLEALVGLAREMAAWLGRELPGCVHKTGAIGSPAASKSA